MKVLVVDDNSAMRQAVCELLSDIGEIYECSDGAEASHCYATWQPDWVLMDIRMKRMNGLVATRELLVQYPDARVVMLTQYGDQELREAARQAGACGYVCKENLLEVRNLLSAT